MAVPHADPNTPPTIIFRQRSVRAIIDQLIANDPAIVASKRNRYAAWKSITIVRNGGAIDTLNNVGKAYHVYQQELDAWAMRTNRPRRPRRAPKSSGVTWKKGRFLKLMDNGTMMPLRDQLQMQSGLRFQRDRKVEFQAEVEEMDGQGESEGGQGRDEGEVL